MAMIFGMPILIEIKSLEETMDLCKELGFSFVELNMNLPQYQVGSLENIDYFIKLKEKYDIGFTIHLDENLNICDFNKAVSAAYVDTVKRTIEVAKRINAPVLNMHMNHGVHFTLPDKKVQLFQEYNESYMRSWEEFRHICEEMIGDLDIKICIENTNGFRNYERNAIEFLLESRVFGLTWDIGHSNAVRNIDEDFIRKYKDKLRHFHIHDSLGKQDHMVLGTGEIDLYERIRIAEECGCRSVVETKNLDGLKESLMWLKENGII